MPKLIKDFRSWAEAGPKLSAAARRTSRTALSITRDAFIHYGLGNLFLRPALPGSGD